MKYVVVTSNLIDLRAEPTHRSERSSQVLFGEPLSITKLKSGFGFASQVDGYKGWVDFRFVRDVTRQHFHAFTSTTNMIVTAETARLFDRPGRACAPYFLYYGTRLYSNGSKAGFRRILLPDGKEFLVRTGALQPIITDKGTRGSEIVTEARRFLGVPYLWGGVTPAGFDCSGFVRTVLRRFGIEMARDTKDQVQQGESIDRQELKTGDLIFFPGHVGIAIGRSRIIHASRGGGGVRINSLTHGSADYRADLDNSFTAARRVL